MRIYQPVRKDRKDILKISIVQYNPEYLAVDNNLDRIDDLCTGVDSDLVVLPELAATGYFFKSRNDLAHVAESIQSSKTCDRLQNIAAREGCTIVSGIAEQAGAGFFNSAVVVTATGVAGVYRKVHLFYREKELFRAGETPFSVVEVRNREGLRYRIGVMVCFDWYFPEAARSLALKGADIIAHPSNLVRKDCPRSMPIRALENHVYTATANRIGSEEADGEKLTFIGQSLICSPEGDVLAAMGKEDEGVASTTIEVVEARNKRITPLNDLFLDRRPGRYYH